MKVIAMVVEVRILSRGGQGGVTGAKILAYAGHIGGKYVQAIPKYGAERKGAPIYADVRISDEKIRTHAPVIPENTHSFIVLENSEEILSQIPFDRIKPGTIVVVNASDEPTILKDKKLKIGIVDANAISEKFGLVKSGTNLVSTIMLGAWIKATGLLSIESLTKAIEEKFGDSEIGIKNKEAIIEAYNTLTYVN